MSAAGGGRDESLPSIKEFRARMAELDDRPKPTTIEEAKARLEEALAGAREDMIRARERATFTEQEREDLTLAAQRGQLGDPMREIGDKVAAGRQSWEDVFENRSDDSPAFAGFLKEQVQEQMPDLKQKIEDADLLR
jgi:phosphoenolpyruvate-protein kinase (PTS system EI component)